jgi:FkbM family methyltransferase
VIALEPDPRHFARLQENLTANHLPHVTALPFAGGREPGVLRLTGYGSDNNNRGVSRVTSPEADWSGPIFEVNARPVDDLLDEHGVDIVHLIKIDVEGFELDVLEGMARGLRGHRYRAVLIELHPALLAAGGVTMGTVTECLRRADYAGWSIDHGPGALRRSAYAAAIEPGDYLRPADDETDDTWPHMLWLAPGEPSPSAAGARCRP